MNFSIITIFPESFESYLDSSVLKRAQKKKIIKINFLNPRNFAGDNHKTTDDKPYGGGPGMVMKAEPILKAIESMKPQNKKQKSTMVLLSPTGKQFNQKMARDWVKKFENIILICGRYEGIDERVKKALQATGHKPQTVSIGPYILTGGELPAMVIVDVVSRYVPGVLGKMESLEEKRFGRFYPLANPSRRIGVKVYTRPEVIEFEGKKYRVPKVLLSGDHKKIEEWRKKVGNLATRQPR